MKVYLGIVDALGLESFKGYVSKATYEMEKQLGFLKLRAQLNPQRNAVAYVIEISPKDVKKVKALLDKKSFIKAGQIITKILDKRDGKNLTKINKNLLNIYKLRGYL